MNGGLGPELRERAAVIEADAHAIGSELSREARTRTSVACQRALLRAFGVGGLAPNGRPLALEVVRRSVEAQPRLLRTGIALPFALAAHEYDLDPQQLALEVAAGHVDLAAESALLRDHARSGPATELLGAWLAGADDRIDANRIARRDLIEVLGDPPRPWLVTDVRAYDARDATGECLPLVAGGADVVRVRVPRDGELRDDIGRATPEDDWPVGPDAPPPSGSQRGLALLRSSLDEAGAKNGRYARLAARRVGLAAPELAVVAGFERVDVVFTDPMQAIVDVGVWPERALVDHAFAQALMARSGVRLVLGAGAWPAPGAPDSAASESGRSLALQAIGRAFALANGMAPGSVELGTVPLHAAQSSRAPELLAEIVIRAALFEGHPLVVEDHVTDVMGVAMWPLLTTWMAVAPGIGMVATMAPSRGVADARLGASASARAAGTLADGARPGELRGRSLEHASAVLDAALDALAVVRRSGIAGIVGVAGDHRWLGAEGLAPLDLRPDRTSRWPWESPESMSTEVPRGR